MGRKVNPVALRLGINKDWISKWFSKGGKYSALLKEDHNLRDFIAKKYPRGAVEKILIERNPNLINVIIRSAKPGIIIGRGGKGMEDLKKELHKIVRTPLRLEIQEIRNPDAYAKLVADSVAEQLERRMPFRRILKQTAERVSQNREVAGIRIQIAGRLGGADMSRREKISKGKIPLQTLRANIDFSKATAITTYGTVGVKVWLYKNQGEKGE